MPTLDLYQEYLKRFTRLTSDESHFSYDQQRAGATLAEIDRYSKQQVAAAHRRKSPDKE